MIDLEGVIDLHVHTAPDVRPRYVDDLELARQAAQAGMRAVLIKSHHTLTADRASIVEKVVKNVRVFGGLVLNHAVGGLNPAAVEAALTLGAKEIWMPTLSAAGGSPINGISILDDGGTVKPTVFEILDLIAQRDVILGTGHLTVPEIQKLVFTARSAGVKRIVITHPELPSISMPLAVQQELCGGDVFFERCYLVTIARPRQKVIPLNFIAATIRQIGCESTLLATDFGQVENGSPIEGMREYIASLMNLGITQIEIDRMARHNPAWLLNL